MREVFIVSAVRSAIGHFGGSLKDHSPVDLAAPVLKAAVDRAGIDPGKLDLVIMGNILRAGQGQLVPRQAAMKAGIPDHVDGLAVDMVCSSGMYSVMAAATHIRAGEAEAVLAGGTESMSASGFYLSSRARWGYKYLAGAPEQLVDILHYDGLTDPFTGEAMGLQTEKLIAELGITRGDMDAVAAESHRRAAEAQAAGRFSNEIVGIEYRKRREMAVLSHDEGVRPETTIDTLSGLRPAFSKDGTLTAGNSSQISDGAAALIVASGDFVRANGLTPLARYDGGTWVAGEPYRFSEAPVPAVTRLAERLGSTADGYDLYENNEAFALNTVIMRDRLGIDDSKLNVNGGAIALGHPIGCSGARILVTLIHALRQRDKETGMAAICHGTGGGTAVAVTAV